MIQWSAGGLTVNGLTRSPRGVARDGTGFSVKCIEKSKQVTFKLKDVRPHLQRLPSTCNLSDFVMAIDGLPGFTMVYLLKMVIFHGKLLVITRG